jgi:hypothetical protein
MTDLPFIRHQSGPLFHAFRVFTWSCRRSWRDHRLSVRRGRPIAEHHVPRVIRRRWCSTAARMQIEPRVIDWFMSQFIDRKEAKDGPTSTS